MSSMGKQRNRQLQDGRGFINDGIIMSECSDFTDEQLDFILAMCEYIPVEVSKKKVYSLKDVKVKYRCEHTGDWVDMLINEDGLSVKSISWDEGVDITNDLLDLTIEDNKTLKQHLSEYRNTEHGSDFDSFKLL